MNRVLGGISGELARTFGLTQILEHFVKTFDFKKHAFKSKWIQFLSSLTKKASF